MSEFWSGLSAGERRRIRAEMLKIAADGIRSANPGMTKGAAIVKASKFVDAAIAQESMSHGETEHSRAQIDTVQ